MYLNAEEMPYLRKLRGQAARQELRRQQAEAARGRAQKIGLRVKVLVAGVFNDPHHRAHQRAADFHWRYPCGWLR